MILSTNQLSVCATHISIFENVIIIAMSYVELEEASAGLQATYIYTTRTATRRFPRTFGYFFGKGRKE